MSLEEFQKITEFKGDILFLNSGDGSSAVSAISDLRLLETASKIDVAESNISFVGDLQNALGAFDDRRISVKFYSIKRFEASGFTYSHAFIENLDTPPSVTVELLFALLSISKTILVNLSGLTGVSTPFLEEAAAEYFPQSFRIDNYLVLVCPQ